MVAGLRARDPLHPAFVSLFPNYAPIPDYDRYVRDFVRANPPGGDRLRLLPVPRRRNRPNRVLRQPPRPSDGSRSVIDSVLVLRAADARSRDYAARARAKSGGRRCRRSLMGRGVVMFFTYWSNVSAEFPEPGVIDPRTGLPTAHYAEVRRVNGQARAFGRALAAARSRSVFHNGPLADGAVMRPPRAPVYFPSRAPITTGLFESAAYRYAMFANRDYRADGLDDGRAQLRAPLARAARPGEWPMGPGARRSQKGAFGHYPACTPTGRGSPLPDPEGGAVWSAGRGSGVRPSASESRTLEPGGLTRNDLRAPWGGLARVPFRVRAGRREVRVERLLALCPEGSR